MILSLRSGELARSHAIRIAAAVKGGAIDSVGLGHHAQKSLARGYRKRGRMILADKDSELQSIPVALEYLNDLMPKPPLMPASPAARAAVRLYMETACGEALDGSETCSEDALRFWDWTAAALVRGGGCLTLGVANSALQTSLADCAAFPVIHRLMRGHRELEFRMPPNTGFMAIAEWLEKCYADPRFNAMSMTDSERG